MKNLLLILVALALCTSISLSAQKTKTTGFVAPIAPANPFNTDDDDVDEFCADTNQCKWTCIISELYDNPIEFINAINSYQGCNLDPDNPSLAAFSQCIDNVINNTAIGVQVIMDIKECHSKCLFNPLHSGAFLCKNDDFCYTQSQGDWFIDASDPWEITPVPQYISCATCPDFQALINPSGSASYEFNPPTPSSSTPSNVDGKVHQKIFIDNNLVHNEIVQGFQDFYFDVMELDPQEGQIIRFDFDFLDGFAGKCDDYFKEYVFGCPTVSTEFIENNLCLTAYYPETNPPYYPLSFAGTITSPEGETSDFGPSTILSTACYPIENPGGDQDEENLHCLNLELETNLCDDMSFSVVNLCDEYNYCDLLQFQYEIEIIDVVPISAAGEEDGSLKIRIFNVDAVNDAIFQIVITSVANQFVDLVNIVVPAGENQASLTINGLAGGQYLFDAFSPEYCQKYDSAIVDTECDCKDDFTSDPLEKGTSCDLNIEMNATQGTGGNNGTISITSPTVSSDLPGTISSTALLPGPMYVYWEDSIGYSNILDYENVPPGEHCATIYYTNDLDECRSVRKCVTVPEPDCTYLFQYSIQLSRPCLGESNGALTVIVWPPAMDFHVEWDNGSTETSLTDLGVGNYSGTIYFGEAECPKPFNVDLDYAESFSVSIEAENQPNCSEDSNDGSLVALVNGASSVTGYEFSWSNGMTSQQISGLNAGTYSVIVTDNSGCIETAEFELLNSSEGLSTQSGDCNITTLCEGVVIDIQPLTTPLSTIILGGSCFTSGCQDGVPIEITTELTGANVIETDGSDPCNPCKFLVMCPSDPLYPIWLSGQTDWTGDGISSVQVEPASPSNESCGSCLYQVKCRLFSTNTITFVQSEIASYDAVAQGEPDDMVGQVSLEPYYSIPLPPCFAVTGDGSTELVIPGGTQVTTTTTKRGKFSPGNTGNDISYSPWSLQEVFPNPFDDELNLEITAEKEEEVLISIYDSSGRLVERLSLNVFEGQNSIPLNMEEQMANGLYFLEIIDNEGHSLTRKISKN